MLQIMDDIFHLCEVVLMINGVDWTTESLDLNQILEDGVTLVLPLNVKDGIIQSFDLLNRFLQFTESVISTLNIIARSLEAPERLNLFSNFIKMMSVLTALSDWVGQLLRK